MIDPVSALGSVSFALAILGLLANTASGLYDRVLKARECEERLYSMRLQLLSGDSQLRTWRWTWSGVTPFPDEVYIQFWGGRRKFDDVCGMLESIAALYQEISSILRNPQRKTMSLKTIDVKEWLAANDIADERQLILSRATAKPRGSESVARRIAFAFYEDAVLQEKIERFRSQIQMLVDFTQRHFRLLRAQNPSLEVTHGELEDTIGLRAFIDRVSNTGIKLHNLQRVYDDSILWALELKPPQDGYESPINMWKEIEAMHIDFLVRGSATAGHGHRAVERVRLFAGPESTAIHDSREVDDRLGDTVAQIGSLLRNTAETGEGFGGSFTILEKPSSLSRPIRIMLNEGLYSSIKRKSFELERANLMYSLAHWCIALWNTPWSSRLCTCGIRCVTVPDSAVSHTFKPSSEGFHRPPACHSAANSNKRRYLLGVALAELVLARPISICDTKELTYAIDGQSLSWKALMYRLRKEVGRNPAVTAISYCLDPDSVAAEPLLEPQHFNEYCKNILKP